jgi:hypothetical protein
MPLQIETRYMLTLVVSKALPRGVSRPDIVVEIGSMGWRNRDSPLPEWAYVLRTWGGRMGDPYQWIRQFYEVRRMYTASRVLFL